MNQSYSHVNVPYATLTRASNVRSAIVQNNAHALLSRILRLLNSNLSSIRVMYSECMNNIKYAFRLILFYYYYYFHLRSYNWKIEKEYSSHAIAMTFIR